MEAVCLATAVYLQNRMATTALESGRRPYQRWYGKKPNFVHIHVFGCMVHSHVPEGKGRKLDNKAQELCFIGYTDTGRNYRVWDEKTKTCYIYHDVFFNEFDFG